MAEFRHSLYMRSIIRREQADVNINRSLDMLRAISHKFDAIAFTGMSGALVAPILARELGKELIIVRKGGDCSHSTYRTEGVSDAKSYIIADDFIDSGKTVKRMIGKIADFSPDSKFIGTLEVSRTSRRRMTAGGKWTVTRVLHPYQTGRSRSEDAYAKY